MSENFRGEDLSSLFSDHATEEFLRCHVCNSEDLLDWADCGYSKAKKCTNCNLVFMTPQLSQEGLNDYYSNYIGKRRINNFKKMEQRAEQYKLDSQQLKRFIEKGNLLDIGCNGGFFLNELGNKFTRYGTEVDPSSINYAKEKYSEFAGNISLGNIEDIDFKDKTFDAITMRGVIEHVKYPREVLSKVSNLLNENGYFYICATPNGECLIAEIYRSNWNLFHPVQHLWHFSPKNLELLCNEFNLKLVWQSFQYLETPYANPKEDIERIQKKITNNDDQEISPPFFENMMSLIFKKLR